MTSWHWSRQLNIYLKLLDEYGIAAPASTRQKLYLNLTICGIFVPCGGLMARPVVKFRPVGAAEKGRPRRWRHRPTPRHCHLAAAAAAATCTLAGTISTLASLRATRPAIEPPIPDLLSVKEPSSLTYLLVCSALIIMKNCSFYCWGGNETINSISRVSCI